MDERDAESAPPRLSRWRYSPEVSLGQIMTSIAVAGPMLLWWGNFNAEIAVIKHSQAAQAESIRDSRKDIKEIGNEVREQGRTLEEIKSRVNRARL